MNPAQLPLALSPPSAPYEPAGRPLGRTPVPPAPAPAQQRADRPPPTTHSPTPVADRRRAHDRARQEAHAADRREIAEAYLFECANRERLRLPQVGIEEFRHTRDWLGF